MIINAIFAKVNSFANGATTFNKSWRLRNCKSPGFVVFYNTSQMIRAASTETLERLIAASTPGDAIAFPMITFETFADSVVWSVTQSHLSILKVLSVLAILMAILVIQVALSVSELEFLRFFILGNACLHACLPSNISWTNFAFTGMQVS